MSGDSRTKLLAVGTEVLMEGVSVLGQFGSVPSPVALTLPGESGWGTADPRVPQSLGT